jgi:hypothetical protein
MESILNKKEDKLRQIIKAQNDVKAKCAVKTKDQSLRLKFRRDEADKNKRKPPLTKGFRIKDRHLLQIVLGTLNDRNLKRYNELGITEAMARAEIAKRPYLQAKLDTIELGFKVVK